MKKLFRPAPLAYIALVVIVNILFSYVPMLATPLGLVSPVAFIVGAVFVVRDFAQRQAGHFILLAMVIATVISYLMADPFVAVASALAFVTSEIFDYASYSLTKKEFHKRILISSIVSTPVDTFIFLYWINGFTAGTFALMIASKLVAAVGIYAYYALRDERTLSAA